MQTLFVDQLTVIDFAYFHFERGIVGESLILDIELSGELNDEGMLFDFSFVKKRIKSYVDELVDHKFLVAKNNASVKYQQTPQQITLELSTNNGDLYKHVSPAEAICLIDSDRVTPSSICEKINQNINSILPDNILKVGLHLREEIITDDYYHYSHGLKKHLGDCQRIAHGHRSKIRVWENNQPSQKWSAYIAKLWQDIYLGTEEDIKETISHNNKDYWVFEYHANQGLFQLMIPQERCFLLKTDTTVELIAVSLAEHIKQQATDSKIKVKAFEGVDKGAIAVV
jgi:6-pyruvoyl-tetrahydropterin synthase